MMVTRYLLAGLVVLLQLLDLSVGLPAADFVSVAVRFVDSETIQLQDGTVFHSERSLAQPTEQRTLRRGEGGDEEVSPINIVLTVSCVLMAALAAGLTMGLVSLDVDDIELAIAQGEIAEKPEVPGKEHDVPDPSERRELIEDKKYAEKLQFFVRNGHWTMVTLLLLNAGANEALPIFLDKLVPSPVIAILISVTAVLIFGEILPTAFFTGPNQYKLAAKLSPIVWVALVLTSVISYPISRLLDLMLGDHVPRMTKCKMRAMLKIEEKGQAHATSCMHVDEIQMQHGALDLRTTTTTERCVPLGKVNMIEIDSVLDIDMFAQIYHWGHSRVPVYEKHPHNVRGYIACKNTILLNPREKEPKSIRKLGYDLMTAVHKDDNLIDTLNKLQDHKVQMACVCDDPKRVKAAWDKGESIPPDVHMVGLITVNEIIEVLIGEDLPEDEDDVRLRTLHPLIQQYHQDADNTLASNFRAFRKILKLEKQGKIPLPEVVLEVIEKPEPRKGKYKPRSVPGVAGSRASSARQGITSLSRSSTWNGQTLPQHNDQRNSAARGSPAESSKGNTAGASEPLLTTSEHDDMA